MIASPSISSKLIARDSCKEAEPYKIGFGDSLVQSLRMDHADYTGNEIRAFVNV